MKTPIILENAERLSKSILWEMQHTAYCQFGPEAWTQKGVPSYITSNPFTTHKFAQVVLGYLKDCSAPNATNPIDLSHPVYLFDIGAGSGRFAFLFLKTLTALLTIPDLKICYVMTDIAEKNIAFWQQHPYLKPFLESGILDVAYYHSEQEEPLQLLYNKKTLTQKDIKNPIIVIANYFFDTIPQDLFRLKNGHLEEGRISISIDPKVVIGSPDKSNPNVIPHLTCSYTYEPILDSSNYYSHPLLNTLLNMYSEQFDNIPFLFPIGAFESIQYFSKLSKNKMCLLAGDQGVCTPIQIENWGEPKISRHGTLSIPVNYHAIAKYFTIQTGLGLLTTYSDPQFVVMTGVLGGSHFPETITAFMSHLDSFEPCDFWKLVNCAESETKTLSLEFILLLLKLGYWDPMILNSLYNNIRTLTPNLSPNLQQQLKLAINNVWNNYYPVGSEGGHFIMNLGVLLFELEDYPAALACFKHSLELMGPDPQLLQNISACMAKMR